METKISFTAWAFMVMWVMGVIALLFFAVAARADTVEYQLAFWSGPEYVVMANVDVYGQAQKNCWPLHIPDNKYVGAECIRKAFASPYNICKKTEVAVKRELELLLAHYARYSVPWDED